MSSPISVSCPHCRAKLKLGNPKLVGRKIRCPKCSKPFQVSVPDEADAGLAALDEFDNFEDDSYTGADDYEDDYGSDDDYQTPLPSRRGASASKKGKGGKKKSRPAAWHKPVLFGGLGLVALGALIGVGFLVVKLISGFGGNRQDLAYLPADAETVVQVRVADTWNAPIVQSVAANETIRGLVDQMQDKFGLQVGDIDSVLFGTAGNDRWVAVVRTRKPLAQDKIQSTMALGDAQSHAGAEYHLAAGRRPTAVYFAGSSLMILGSENEVKAAIDGGQSTSRPELNFVDFSRHVVFVSIPKTPGAPGATPGLPGGGPFGSLSSDLKGKLRASSFGLTFKSGIDVQGQFDFQDRDAAEQALEQVAQELDKARTMLETQRQQLANAPPQMSGFSKMAEESLALSEAVLNSTKSSRSGSTLRVTASMPESVKSSLEQMAPMMAGMVAMGLQMQTAGLQGNAPGFTPPSSASLGDGAPSGNRMSDPREAARRAGCRNNLKKIGLAMHNFHDQNRMLPPAAVAAADGRPLLSWRVQILPYLEEGELYKEFRLDEPWDSPHNKALIPRMPDLFKCMNSSAPSGYTRYLAVRGRGTLFEDGLQIRFADVQDGLSNTILAVEADDSRAVVWTKPDDLTVDAQNPRQGLGAAHGDGFNALFADGSIRFIPATTEPASLFAMFTRAGRD
jgi:prepilin-type processing-associated H-X9-DG protein